MSDSGTRLTAALADRYRIERELGEGGMATVYLAQDLKHDRKVALKVLKPELAAVLGAERFVVEIKTTAALQHPHILPLFDSGTADGFLFYVMPFIDGETLRAKLDRDGQLGVDEAVRIASDVAEALHYAHQNGVIHRDIKPENILLANGRPMVADFGIALAVSAAAGGRMTETGLSLGTPHYMSPEQATAEKEITARSDIYSLGSVLYEMLTGEPPHMGNSAQAIIMKIVTEDAQPVTRLRKSVPPNVAAAVARAVERLPADRFESAKGFAEALANPGFQHGAVGGGSGVHRGAPPSRGRALMPWGVAGVLAVALVAVLASPRGETATTPVRFTVPLGADPAVLLGGPDEDRGRPTRTAIAFSPDGNLLVYSARDSAGSRLYRRRLDQDLPEAIPGTEEAYHPFFSPDGAWVAFFVRGALKRIPVAGGSIETILSGGPTDNAVAGASWADDDTIIFGLGRGLLRVPAVGGGEAVRLVELDTASGEQRLDQPEVLPGSRAVLVHISRANDPATSQIVAIDLATGARTVVVENGMDPIYRASGHLLFTRLGTLMAARFDPDRLAMIGEPVTILPDVMQTLFTGSGQDETGATQVATSARGHLAYAIGGAVPEVPHRVMRLTTAGRSDTLDLAPREYWLLRISPDGRSVASHSGAGQQNDLWVHDLTRGVSRKLNTGGFTNQEPAWSPDGKWLAFRSDRDGSPSNLYRMAADGSGEPERLAPSTRGQNMSSWSVHGTIAYLEGGDIWLLPPDGAPAPWFTSPSREWDASFSPDGKWLAYVSDVSGRAEVYVRPFPGPEPAVQVSGERGSNPAWAPDQRSLYYTWQGSMMVVDVSTGSTFQVGRPRLLFRDWQLGRSPVRGYDVTADGSFLTIAPGDRSQIPVARELHVILNFNAELEQRLPR